MTAAVTTVPYRACLARGITLTRVEGKDVLFSVRTGDSFGLNEVGAQMVRLLIESGSQNAIDALAAEYSAPRQTIAEDLDELVTELSRQALLVVER
jgi:hypothetical protein